MLILSNSSEQTVAPGQAVTFDTVILHTGCAEVYRQNIPSLVVLCARNAIYELEFSGNIGSTEASTQAQLNFETDKAPLSETTMISTTVAAGDLNNVSTGTRLKTFGCCGVNDSITLVNTGTTSVNITNPCLRIKRVA